jgi:hypothetical protein
MGFLIDEACSYIANNNQEIKGLNIVQFCRKPFLTIFRLGDVVDF